MTKQVGDYLIAAIVGITIGSLLLFVTDRATAEVSLPVIELITPVTETVTPVIIETITDCVEIIEYDMNTGTKTTIGCTIKEST